MLWGRIQPLSETVFFQMNCCFFPLINFQGISLNQNLNEYKRQNTNILGIRKALFLSREIGVDG